MTPPTPITGEEVADVLERAAERERELAAHADVYDRIHAFLDELSKETYAAYLECAALRSFHMSVLQIKSDYRGLVVGNREDVEIYAALRSAATAARQQGEGK